VINADRPINASRLHGRTAIITGAARGMGAAHAARLAAEGAYVFACDVLDDDGVATAQSLKEAGLSVEYVHLDVTSVQQWRDVVDRAVTTTGRLDVLVNNAGIVHATPLTEESLLDWNTTFAVNATGPFLGIQAVTPALKSNGGGSIINIASTYGVVGCENYVSYCASKSALLGVTRVAAIELAPDSIRVNAICPGGVNTAQNANGGRAKTVEMTPMGRRGHVSEVSGAIAYLACDDSTFTTGAIIPVDGGYLTQ